MISSFECQIIKGERNSVDMRIKLLEQIEQKDIPTIRIFLEILKSDENFRGFGYLAEMVEKDFDRLVEEEKVPTTNGKQQAEFSCHYCEHDDISRNNADCTVWYVHAKSDY